VARPFIAGQFVQTPFGKGVVRAVRNNGRLLVEVKARALEFTEQDVTAVDRPRAARASRVSPDRSGPSSGPSREQSQSRADPEVDLHGLTVAEALDRAERAINTALLSDARVLRLIHGRSGGRIKSALQARLQAISAVRGSRVDPRNQGVTIVEF
jgi:dsDNA-specific endonuclease/ATPase MutS2